MTENEPHEGYDCETMPKALDFIFSDENMPDLPCFYRSKLQRLVAQIEGSNPAEALTCVAKEDYPKITAEIREGIENNNFNQGLYMGYPKRLQGFLRGLNRHCDECTKEECANRVDLTRKDIKAISRISYTNSRRAKVDHPQINEAVA